MLCEWGQICSTATIELPKLQMGVLEFIQKFSLLRSYLADIFVHVHNDDIHQHLLFICVNIDYNSKRLKFIEDCVPQTVVHLYKVVLFMHQRKYAEIFLCADIKRSSFIGNDILKSFIRRNKVHRTIHTYTNTHRVVRRKI